MSSIDTLLAAALAALNEVQDVVTLEQVKARYLGKSGEITELLKQLGKLHIHFIGIGGAGMSGIARIMLAKSIEWVQLFD